MWCFSVFYRNPNPSFRKASWDLLRRLRTVDSLPWVCGDFNELLCINEKLGGLDKLAVGTFNFQAAVDDCNLIDLGFASPKFTWNNKRDGNENIQE